MIVTLLFISIIGGFISGLLGIGGAVVMIPLIMTIPPLFNLNPLSVKTIAGLSMIQALFSSISGIIIHKKNSFVHLQTLFFIGIPMGISSLSGSYFSKYMDDQVILVILGCMILLAFYLLLASLMKNRENKNSPETDKINPGKVLSIFIGTLAGSLSGIVGAGGGFLLTPIMINILKLPTKTAIGTSLGIIFIGTFFGAIGKLISFQVELLLVIPVVAGSLISSQLGARVSKLLSPTTLKTLLLLVILISLVQVIIQLI